jgi:hypothetical protein
MEHLNSKESSTGRLASACFPTLARTLASIRAAPLQDAANRALKMAVALPVSKAEHRTR